MLVERDRVEPHTCQLKIRSEILWMQVEIALASILDPDWIWPRRTAVRSSVGGLRLTRASHGCISCRDEHHHACVAAGAPDPAISGTCSLRLWCRSATTCSLADFLAGGGQKICTRKGQHAAYGPTSPLLGISPPAEVVDMLCALFEASTSSGRQTIPQFNPDEKMRTR